MSGKTVDNVHALDILTYRGEQRVVRNNGSRPILDAVQALGARVATTSRQVPGPDPPRLRIQPGPAAARAGQPSQGNGRHRGDLRHRLGDGRAGRRRPRAARRFPPDAYTAADHVTVVRELGPLTIEGMDAGLVPRCGVEPAGAVALLPQGGGWLLAEFGGAIAAEACACGRGAAQDSRHTRSAFSTTAGG